MHTRDKIWLLFSLICIAELCGSPADKCASFTAALAREVEQATAAQFLCAPQPRSVRVEGRRRARSLFLAVVLGL